VEAGDAADEGTIVLELESESPSDNGAPPLSSSVVRTPPVRRMRDSKVQSTGNV
jgi:hypothetical protein